MLSDHPEEQLVLFKEIVYKRITVREAESLLNRVAYDRVRKKDLMPILKLQKSKKNFKIN